jgi:hypothetical protein
LGALVREASSPTFFFFFWLLELNSSKYHFSGHQIPFGVIFGGTDLNEDANQLEKSEVMGKVLEEAR